MTHVAVMQCLPKSFLKKPRIYKIETGKLSRKNQQLDASGFTAAQRLAAHLKRELHLRREVGVWKPGPVSNGKGKGKCKGNVKSSLLHRLATATVHNCPPPGAP